jgi:hypothetical protein
MFRSRSFSDFHLILTLFGKEMAINATHAEKRPQ